MARGNDLQGCTDAVALAEAIARRCEDAHPYQDSWRARCPLHQGHSDTSLSILPSEDRVLIKCFAECATTDIVHALDLTMADLFVCTDAHRQGWGQIVQVYDYYDVYGTLRHQTVRFHPKAFRQRRPDPARVGAFVWNLKGIETILYHLPEVIAAISRDETIYIVEGEKDADALQAVGLTATCSPMGAGKWRKQYTATLQDAHVVVLPDNDTPGMAHAEKIAQHLQGVAADVKVVHGLYTAAAGSDVSDWLAQGGTREEFHAISASAPAYVASAPPVSTPKAPPSLDTPQPAPFLPYSDYTNALALVKDHGHGLRYVYPWKSWLVWTGTHWARDTSGAVMRLAKATIKRLASRLPDLEDDAAKALMAHIKKSLSTSALEAMVKSAQSEEGIALQPEAIDHDPWLLNCLNGTLDLRTGHLREHRQADILTKCLPVAYNPAATCPTWTAFLWRIMGGSQGEEDPDMGIGELANRQAADERAMTLMTFLQQATGYALTGSTREQCMFILHGPTKTGKSTFLATLRALLGPYGQQADMASFSHKDRDEVRNDLADLAGSRFVCALESQEGKRLAESLVKQLTGGADLIKARFLFQEHFVYKPQFKLFLGTNHKPVIRDTDGAIWERLRLVPFIVQIPKEDRDKTLEERLQHELPGILAWAVQGCLAWQQAGALAETQAVTDATATYRDEMDDLGRFLSDVCTLNEACKSKSSVLLKAYQQWSGHSTETAKAFAQKLMERGYETKHTNTGAFWLGIGLPADETGSDRYT